MNETQFQNWLSQMVEEATESPGIDTETADAWKTMRDFQSIGILSDNVGLVFSMADRSEFQVTIVQSQGDDEEYNDGDHEFIEQDPMAAQRHGA